MPLFPTIFLISVLLSSSFSSAQYSATYLPSNAPAKTEQGQTGTNQCGTASNQNSECQNAYINSVADFCVFAPPNPGPDSVIGNTERIEVSWCLQSGTGARLIPDGAIKGAHFIQTPDFVQVTGIGDLTLLNIPAGDAGGELDPHGADGNGNPIGGLVFSSAFGQLEQLHEWTNFVAADEFCFRACKPGPNAARLCQHIYDVMGCAWNMPGNYNTGFTNCQADSGEPMGVYGTSTFFQGQPVTPAAHPAPSSSLCATFNTIGGGFIISTTSPSPPPATQSTFGTTSAVSSPVPSFPSSAKISSIATFTSPTPTASAPVVGSAKDAGGAPSGTSTPGTSTPGGSAAMNTSSSAASSVFTAGWERNVLVLASGFICFLTGAGLVL